MTLRVLLRPPPAAFQPSLGFLAAYCVDKMSEIEINDHDFQSLKGKVILITGSFSLHRTKRVLH